MRPRAAAALSSPRIARTTASRCRCSDTGRGIPREYLPRLFGKFIQVPGSATGSAGLGLAISRQIVQAHGGDIRAASEPGHGATFTFTLPVAGSRGDAAKETHDEPARVDRR